MKQYIGFLIRQKRLQMNLSQEGLCKGICVVSYLSKIEQGTVNAGEDIIEQLFTRLKISYITDAQKLKEMKENLSSYFDAFFHREETSKWEEFIDEQSELYQTSQLNLSWQLYQLYRESFQDSQIEEPSSTDQVQSTCNELKKYEPYMTRNQRFLFGYLMGYLSESSYEDRMNWLNMAGQQFNCSIIYNLQGEISFNVGKYMDSIRYFERAYQMAAEEGNALVLFNSSFMLATCYTNHDYQNMMRYYQRTLELARTIAPQSIYNIYYNIGATLVEHKQYEEAIENLEKAKRLLTQSEENPAQSEKRKNHINWLLLYHKLSFSHIQLGHIEKAREYLALAKEYIDDNSIPGLIKMLRLIEMRLDKDYVQNPEYEALLLDVYESVGDELGYGFRNFHGRYLVELYKVKRRYKDALEITEEIERTLH